MKNIKWYPVKKLFNGIAFLRDYNVYNTFLDGSDLGIIHGDSSIVIQHESIYEKAIVKTKKVISSQFKNSPDYKLIGFIFNRKNSKTKKVVDKQLQLDL